jgi:hypothetical protein
VANTNINTFYSLAKKLKTYQKALSIPQPILLIIEFKPLLLCLKRVFPAGWVFSWQAKPRPKLGISKRIAMVGVKTQFGWLTLEYSS